MNNSTILLISQGSLFMTDALVKNLNAAGYEVQRVEPLVEEVERQRSKTDLFLIFSGNFVYQTTDALVYVKDLCAAENKPLCIIGYEKELDEIGKTIPDVLVTKKFIRPFDMRVIVDDIGQALEKGFSDRAGKQILLVDDDSAFLKMMQGWLSMKYQVTIVNSGMQAITYLAVHKPDLILLDYEMPITSGPQVLEMIRSAPHTESIPVIFLTGKSDRESVTSALRLKPDGYLLKTMSKEDIVNSVEHFFLTKKWKEFNAGE